MCRPSAAATATVLEVLVRRGQRRCPAGSRCAAGARRRGPVERCACAPPSAARIAANCTNSPLPKPPAENTPFRKARSWASASVASPRACSAVAPRRSSSSVERSRPTSTPLERADPVGVVVEGGGPAGRGGVGGGAYGGQPVELLQRVRDRVLARAAARRPAGTPRPAPGPPAVRAGASSFSKPRCRRARRRSGHARSAARAPGPGRPRARVTDSAVARAVRRSCDLPGRDDGQQEQDDDRRQGQDPGHPPADGAAMGHAAMTALPAHRRLPMFGVNRRGCWCTPDSFQHDPEMSCFVHCDPVSYQRHP